MQFTVAFVKQLLPSVVPLYWRFTFFGLKQCIICRWPAHHSEPQQDKHCPGMAGTQFKHSAGDVRVLQKKNYVHEKIKAGKYLCTVASKSHRTSKKFAFFNTTLYFEIHAGFSWNKRNKRKGSVFHWHLWLHHGQGLGLYLQCNLHDLRLSSCPSWSCCGEQEHGQSHRGFRKGSKP